jgi:hypothetical protein
MVTKAKEEEVKVDIEIPTNIDAPPDGYSVDEWQDLSYEEKAGILDSIKNPEDDPEPEEKKLTQEEKDALAAIAEENKTAEERAAEEKDAEDARIAERAKTEGKTVEEIAKIEEAEKIADAANKKEEVVEVTDDTLLTFRPTLTEAEMPKVPDKPEEIEEVISPEIQVKFKELKAKYDDGDLTADEYQNGRDKLNRQIIKHTMDVNAAAKEEWEASKAAVEEKKSDLLWKKEQIHFLNAKPEYMSSKAVDAAAKIKSNALFGALTEMVKSITGDPANSNLTGMQVLVKADKAVKEAFGIKPAGKKEVIPDKTNKPSAKKPDLKTLADVPAAATNMDGIDDSFALIDKLSGEAYENALERMPDKTRQAYLDRADK